jgi:tetratricopeptide (TPR) repeat protein
MISREQKGIASDLLRRTVLLLPVLLLSACAAAPSAPADGADRAPANTSAAVEPAAPGLPDEAVSAILSGEYLGAEGDLQAATDEYLEAALNSSDPAVAQRATRVAFAAESWQQATMAADRWALLAPDSVPAHESAATAMLKVGDFAGAEYPLERILDILSDSEDAWILVSRILAQANDPEGSEEVMTHLARIRTGADPAVVFFARSKLAAQNNQPEAAFEFARRAVELYPERMDYLTWAGRVALNLKLAPTGIEFVGRAWRLEPDNHDLALAYADLLARNGRLDTARTVMRDMPQAPDVLLSRILFELSANEPLAAEELYRKFETTDFGDPNEQTFYQARAAEALGEAAQAIELYGRITSGDRTLAAALRRAELLGLIGDLPAARTELAGIRERGNPEAAEQAWLTEARLLRESDRLEEALEVLGRAVSDLPASIPLLYSRGLLAAEMGRVEEAERDLRTIVQAQPENAAALNALGYTLADMTDRYAEAEALIRRAFSLQPNEPAIIDSMGWVAFRLGRYEEAGRFLARAWELDRNPEIAAHLGEVLWAVGRREEAVAVWREGAEIDPGNRVLTETLDRLGVTL